jgi:hypothetical protein
MASARFTGNESNFQNAEYLEMKEKYIKENYGCLWVPRAQCNAQRQTPLKP